MSHSIFKIARIIVLISTLPLLAILFSPSNQVNAQCIGTGKIKVDNGLISAIDPSSFTADTTVSCVTEQRASIPQFAIMSYDEMKTLYFDQAKSTFSKTPLTGNQTQSSPTSPIDLSNTPYAPTVTSSKSCLNTSTYSGSELTISWNSASVGKVIISDGAKTWAKNVSGSFTTGPSGFRETTDGTFLYATVGTTYSFSVSIGTNGPTSPVSTFGIRTCLPPICTAISDPSSVEINNTANFTATASDPEGTTLTYLWGASAGTPTSGTSSSFAWTAPSSTGNAIINLRVTSTNGGATNCPAKTITVKLPPPPICTSIDGVSTVEVNSAANFTATVSDPRGAPLTYAWTASVGTPASGTSSSFAWAAPIAPGNKTISLTVTGPGGSTNCTPKSVSVTLPTTYKRVFVAGPTNGNLSGVIGANSYCVTAANAANLCGGPSSCTTGSWKAWLSDGTTTAASNIGPNTNPYKYVTGGSTKIADSKTALLLGSLQNPINKNASGTSVGTVNVWTNTKTDGTAIIIGSINGSGTVPGNCTAFASQSGVRNAKIGSSGSTTSTWTAVNPSTSSVTGTNTCNTPNYLYCFEQ